MALQIYECWDSGSGSVGKEAGDVYSAIAYGDPDPTTGDNADNPYVVTKFALPHFSNVSSTGNILNNIQRTRLAAGVWRFDATYRSPTRDRQTNDACFSFTTGGGSQHITCSRSTVGKYTPAGSNTPAPDCKGTIGNTGDEVAGTEIYVPTQAFKLTFYLPPAAMSGTYLDQVEQLTARVNSDPVFLFVDGIVRSYQPGELLYLNGEGSKRQGFADWEFTLNFMCTRNVTNQTIGPITGINAKGFEYIWVRHKKTVDTTAKVLPITVEAAYVEQVYEYKPLSPLIAATTFGQGNSQPWANPGLVSGGGIS